MYRDSLSLRRFFSFSFRDDCLQDEIDWVTTQRGRVDFYCQIRGVFIINHLSLITYHFQPSHSHNITCFTSEHVKIILWPALTLVTPMFFGVCIFFDHLLIGSWLANSLPLGSRWSIAAMVSWCAKFVRVNCSRSRGARREANAKRNSHPKPPTPHY